MSGLKERFPEVAFGGYKATPDELDKYEVYYVNYPQTSASYIGTTAVGTSTQAKAMVLVSKTCDYPRNLAGAVAGSSDMGGVWVVNGKDQFGKTITETITIGTAANGGTTVGTKVFAEVTSGTCTVTTGAVGAGTPTLGFVTTAGSCVFGLPSKIGGTADVKLITWVNDGTVTAINGGTIGAYVDATAHGFSGTETTKLTDKYMVWYKPTYDNSGQSNMANW